MATYLQIQNHVKAKHAVIVQRCWIAHVKELNGMPLRTAPNRRLASERVKPCPDQVRPLIEESMRHFGML
ncbi:hypothetical protein [Herbaspirillum rubrisubalbicans]|uniref:hypothetical protein n=1 Tax=Herbaspirillum rubrisubalbicans TaxID=80842 RepID=UPI0009EB1BFC|nr:hypothetical protein [Herbaspirillum rubrisubalbicans]